MMKYMLNDVYDVVNEWLNDFPTVVSFVSISKW